MPAHDHRGDRSSPDRSSADSVCEAIRRYPPLAHGGGTPFFGLERDALGWLERTVSADMTTLVTGCGASTIVFAAAGDPARGDLPDPGAHSRVVAYCAEEGSRPTACASSRSRGRRADTHREREPLDLVLIDGAHGFPFPALDWCLTATRLRVGGLVDAYLPFVHVVVRFLRASASWQRRTSARSCSTATRRSPPPGRLPRCAPGQSKRTYTSP